MPHLRRLLALVLLVSACATTGGVAAPSSTTTASTAPLQPATTTTVTTTGPTTSTSIDDPCAGIGEAPRAVAVIDEPDLAEVSGIAYSAWSPGMLWVHNDGGSRPWLWAVGGDGTVLGHVEVDARNVDWEDIALGPGPVDGWYVYIADIGDNLNRRTGVWLHRFGEPDGLTEAATDVESLSIRYPDGPADAEALMVDPRTGDAFIVTKTPTGRSSVMRVAAGTWGVGSVEAETVATIDLGTFALVTAADISRDGSIIAVRTYEDVWLWARADHETVTEALRSPPCRAPAPDEFQGESIALDATGYATLGEGEAPTLFRFDR